MANLAAISALAGLPEPTEWQKRVLDDLLSLHAGGAPRMQVMRTRAQQSGKMLVTRYAIWARLINEGHAHVAARDGLWCVTGDMRQLATFGRLWERLWAPRPR